MIPAKLLHISPIPIQHMVGPQLLTTSCISDNFSEEEEEEEQEVDCQDTETRCSQYLQSSSATRPSNFSKLTFSQNKVKKSLISCISGPDPTTAPPPVDGFSLTSHGTIAKHDTASFQDQSEGSKPGGDGRGRVGGVGGVREDHHMSPSLLPNQETVAWQPVRHPNISRRMETCEEEPTAAGLAAPPCKPWSSSSTSKILHPASHIASSPPADS